MRAAAYLYADGDSPPPRELILADRIARYGVWGVMGRPLGAKEIRAMQTAENIVNAYHNRARSDDWVKWAQNNPDVAHLLDHAMRLANGE